MKKIDNLSDVNTNDYNKSLNICKDIIKEIYNVDYKEYHNI